MSAKTIFFDLDGTLLGKSRILHPENRHALFRLKENGNRICLCSGRSPGYLRNGICREVVFDGIIGCAGGCVYIGDDCIFENELSKDQLLPILNSMRRQEIFYELETKDGIYQSDEGEKLLMNEFVRSGRWTNEQMEQYKKEEAEGYRSGVNRSIREIPDDLDGIRVQKLLIHTGNLQAVENMSADLAGLFHIHYFMVSDTFLSAELIPANCTKEDGIRKVLSHTGCLQSDTIAFGDSINDLQMLEFVNTAVVYEKAEPGLLALADYFFSDPDKGGIAKALIRMKMI